MIGFLFTAFPSVALQWRLRSSLRSRYPSDADGLLLPSEEKKSYASEPGGANYLADFVVTNASSGSAS